MFYISIILFSHHGLASAQKASLYKYVGEVPSPENFMIVYLDNYYEKACVVPVAFAHWLHTAKFTCRLLPCRTRQQASIQLTI